MGKATIQEFISVYDWVEKNQDVWTKHLRNTGLV